MRDILGMWYLDFETLLLGLTLFHSSLLGKSLLLVVMGGRLKIDIGMCGGHSQVILKMSSN